MAYQVLHCFYPLLITGSTQEDPSRRDWKKCWLGRKESNQNFTATMYNYTNVIYVPIITDWNFGRGTQMCSFVCVGRVPICPKILFLQLCMTLMSKLKRIKLLLNANNKGADQSAHTRSLISAIVTCNRYLDNTIASPATCTCLSESSVI